MENKHDKNDGPAFSATRQPTQGAKGVPTRDHDAIRRWADRRGAEPATGETTATGQATAMHVADGESGLRFNYPGFARFRPIGWDEWFRHFDEHGLTFVYEEEIADRAYELYQDRGGDSGHDRDDWLKAERQLGGRALLPMGRYHIVKEG